MIGSLPPTVVRYRVDAESTLELEEAPRSPAAGEVTVEVAGSAVGGAPGCEISGLVIAAGDAAEDWLGRRVVVPRVLPCGECDRCRRGRTASCRAMAPRAALREAGVPDVLSHETVPARYLLSVEPPLWPDGAELAWMAALADAVALPYGAIVRAQVAPGDLCLVLGDGVRARYASAIVAAKGAHPITVDGPSLTDAAAPWDPVAQQERVLAEAERLGLMQVELKVIETTSTALGRARAISLCEGGATVVLLSDGEAGEITTTLGGLVASEGAILGAAACHPDLYPEIAALIARGDVRLQDSIRLRPMSEYAQALRDARSGRSPTLAILTTGGVGH